MNNIDFEAIIKSAMKDGSKAEDLAAAFTEALNAINSEDTKKAERDAWVREHYAKAADLLESEPMKATSALFSAAAAETNPDWDLDTCKMFEESMSDFLPEMIKTFNKFNKGFDTLICILSKSKDKARQGADRIVQCTGKAKEALSDSEKIDKFLKKYFDV